MDKNHAKGWNGNDNDEGEVAAPISIDLDEEDEPELLVSVWKKNMGI